MEKIPKQDSEKFFQYFMKNAQLYRLINLGEIVLLAKKAKKDKLSTAFVEAFKIVDIDTYDGQKVKPFINMNFVHQGLLLRELEFLDDFNLYECDEIELLMFCVYAHVAISQYIKAVNFIKIRGNAKKNNRKILPLQKRLNQMEKHAKKLIELEFDLLYLEKDAAEEMRRLAIAYKKCQIPFNHYSKEKIINATTCLRIAIVSEMIYLQDMLAFSLTDTIEDFINNFTEACSTINKKANHAKLQENIKALQTTIKSIIDAYII
ncbi:hypothetical protein [Campylobacter sp. RM16187]|uniref:hypothetical protein n=1 Tax=Campylobacter sp. RM16187 TaxID=1660063 RepID=UPI0021B63241|nr:hypothetical protein [Campylobacter sp. RM16187]QKG29999.1 hypothetical protein CDOMF_1769 [Campylobacter sp. RM16187]